MIPWASPLSQTVAHRGEIDSALARVLDGGNYVLGEEVSAFEREFASYCGATHGVGVGSGTDALILGLRALDIGAGDEVITVSHTAVATVAAIIACGATPVLVDIDATTFTIDPTGIASAITPRTKAIIAIHLYGQPADMDSIVALARQQKLRVIEDCAQAAGALYRGSKVGSIGDIGCFSFYPTKNLGAIGDGGMVVTSDKSVAERVRRLRQYGWNESRQPQEVGINSRLDPLQAAVLRAKLPHLDTDNKRRAAIAKRYTEGLVGLPLTLPSCRDDASHVYHLYVMMCDDQDEMIRNLAAQSVGSAIHYPIPVHRQRGYVERAFVPAGLPITDQIVGRIVSLPMYPELADADVDQVIAAVSRFYSGRKQVAV